MTDIPREKLIQIIARFGPSVSEDAKRCVGLLRDFCGSYNKEIVVLVAAIREGVVVKLVESERAIPLRVLFDRCAQRLYDHLGIEPELALWSVESWAIALGKIESALEPEQPSERNQLDVHVLNSIGIKLKLIPDGTFMMGEGSQSHSVTLTKPFYLGVYAVTQEEYQNVIGKNPSEFKGARNPVENVSWEEAVAFCRKISALPKEKAAGRVYRLPTEAEWEYSCRAGSITEYCFGDDEAQLGEYAWIIGNSGRRTHPVGQKKANARGLYDMHGNVCEWCSDYWDADYPKGALTDPVGPKEGSYRLNRGGGWFSEAASCRSALRRRGTPDNRNSALGFRLALSPSGIPKSPEADK